MYQQCPICKGKGYISVPLSNTTSNTCPTCNGKRIINENTGLPPMPEQPTYPHPIIGTYVDTCPYIDYHGNLKHIQDKHPITRIGQDSTPIIFTTNPGTGVKGADSLTTSDSFIITHEAGSKMTPDFDATKQIGITHG